jgi:peroxiredoxin
MKKLFLFLAVAFSLTSTSFSQGYKINIKVMGLSDTSVYLGYYYGKFQYVTDTTRLDKTGKGVFENTDTVGGGIYFIIMPNKKYFEFILDKDRILNFETDTTDLVQNLKTKGSDDNAWFFDYQKFIGVQGKLMEKLGADFTRLKAADNKDSLKIVEEKMKAVNKEVTDYKEKFVNDHPKSFVSKVFNASREPVVPEAPILSNGRKDSLFEYKYFRAHFWDDFDLTDDRLLRTPILNNKLDQYFNKVVPQIPDTLIAEIDAVIEKSRPNKEVFKYIVWYLTHQYETSQVMGMDAVFVFLVDKVYRPGDAFWVSDNVKGKIIARADKIKPNLIGKVAPELILIDTNNRLVSLHSIVAQYTVVYFWDPECGHCAKETPKLIKYYNDVKDTLDIKIYAVCSDTSLTRWKKTIHEKKMEQFINVNGTRSAEGNFHDLYDIYSTPVVYLLDRKKRILAKRLPVDQIGPFIEFYEKRPLFTD